MSTRLGESYRELNERKCLETRSRLDPRTAKAAVLMAGGPGNEARNAEFLRKEEKSERLADQIRALCGDDTEDIRTTLMHIRIYLEHSMRLRHNALKGVSPIVIP